MQTFEEFYTSHSELPQKVDQLQHLNEVIQKRARKYGSIGGGIGALIAILLFVFVPDIFSFDTELTIVILLSLLIGGYGMGSWPFIHKRQEKYKNEVQKIVRSILTFIDPNLIYDPKEKISKDLFEKASFFDRLTFYNGKDHIKISFENTAIEFSNLNLQWGGGKYARHANGVFAIIDNFRTVSAPVWVWARGDFVTDIDPQGEKVNLESPNFETLFDVRGDQIESRQIYTPTFMQRMIDLRTQKGVHPFLYFEGKKVYIFLPLCLEELYLEKFGDDDGDEGKNTLGKFEPNLGGKVDKATLKKFYAQTIDMFYLLFELRGEREGGAENPWQSERTESFTENRVKAREVIENVQVRSRFGKVVSIITWIIIIGALGAFAFLFVGPIFF